jgi:hypothetical protein
LSVWDDEGALLSGPSAERTVDLVIRRGATFHVEASVPVQAKRNLPARDERRWALRAAADAHRVLQLGRVPKIGPSTAIQITVDGAS